MQIYGVFITGKCKKADTASFASQSREGIRIIAE
jgi:hypothetical protein